MINREWTEQELTEKIARLERQMARIGDEWLQRVARENIRSWQRKLQELRAKNQPET